MTLHIGLVAPAPPPYGGMANQAQQLRRLLDQEGNLKVSFVQTNPAYTPKIIAEIKGIRALFRLVQYVTKIIRLVNQVDVIHLFANSGWSWQLFSAPVLWIAWLSRTPVIVNYRGGEAGVYFKQSIRWVAPSMNKSSAIVVPSEYLKSIFSQFNFETCIIPNIIDLQRFKQATNTGLENKCPHLIVTRNLEAIYGLSTAIQAVAYLKRKNIAVKLSIAGSGKQETTLRQLVSDLGLSETVFFTGKLTPEQIIELYQTADIMLNPTTVDNMPNSILEAMASRVAIITTNVGGIPHIVENEKTALFVNVNDSKAMAECVIRLINDSQLYSNLTTNGYTTVKQYEWSQVKQDWLALYQKLGSKS